MTIKPTKPIAKSAPVSVRLTHEEREVLRLAAGDTSLSDHIRGRLFGEDQVSGIEPRLSPQAQQRLLARILVALGKSEITTSLAELADLARLGLLPPDADLADSLDAARKELQTLRADLLRALGSRPRKDEDTP